MNNFSIKSLVGIAILICLNTSCVRLDFSEASLQHTITLVTDWNQRTAGVDKPSKYVVSIAGEILTFEKDENQLTNIGEGMHSAIIYNEPENISISGSIASVNTVNAEVNTLPGWLFSATKVIDIDNQSKVIEVSMTQQVREVTFNLEVINGGSPIKSIKGKLTGLSNQINLSTGNLIDSEVEAKLDFIPSSTKFISTIRSFGIVTKQPQKLLCNITLKDGSQRSVESDISSKLQGFNINKHIPLTVNIKWDLDSGEISVISSIDDWEIE